jgi:hypothetical protein
MCVNNTDEMLLRGHPNCRFAQKVIIVRKQYTI